LGEAAGLAPGLAAGFAAGLAAGFFVAAKDVSFDYLRDSAPPLVVIAKYRNPWVVRASGPWMCSRDH
jgi:hypothetical protein